MTWHVKAIDTDPTPGFPDPRPLTPDPCAESVRCLNGYVLTVRHVGEEIEAWSRKTIRKALERRLRREAGTWTPPWRL